MSPSHAVSGECLHPAGTEASLRRRYKGNGGDDRSVLNSSAVGWHVEFWQTAPVGTMTAGARIVHAKLYMHASYATHPVENTWYSAHNTRDLTCRPSYLPHERRA